MFYPKLTEQRQQTLTTEAFLGYDHDLKLSDGEFYDMENLTSDCYPLLAPRVRRGTVQALSGMQAICARDRLCWVQNQVLHINGASMEAYMPSVNIKAGEKQLVSMGAYLCIFPDGIYFNTEDYSDNGYMGHENTVDAAETPISVSLCLADGQALTLSFSQAAQPESPSNGQYWLDTSGSLHTIKQWAEASGQWVSVPTVYVKLAANGIGKGFKQYDGIEISGLSGNEQLKKLNGSQILYGADESSIVIVGLIDQAAEVTSGTVKTARRVPDMDFITECGNRLWGCKYGVADGKTVNELYCCKLGDFKNWACYQGGGDGFVAGQLRYGREMDGHGDAGRQSGVFQGGLLPPGLSVGLGRASGRGAEVCGCAERVKQEPRGGGRPAVLQVAHGRVRVRREPAAGDRRLLRHGAVCQRGRGRCAREILHQHGGCGAQLVAVRLRHAQGSVAPGGQHARKRVCAGRRRAVFP